MASFDSDPGPEPQALSLDELRAHVRRHWFADLGPRHRSAVVAWSSFAATFVSVRALTHWIRDGHGPAGGGIQLRGEHFHHYNLGIAGLAGVGAVVIYGRRDHRHAPLVATAYGAASALVIDEAALLLDLRDVYWAKQGRTSVDLAIAVIAVGGVVVAGADFWRGLARDLRRELGRPQ